MKLFPHQAEALERTAVVGFEGLYEIDRMGNVYSLIQSTSRRKRTLKPYSNTAGYMRVNLYDENGKCKKKYVHRLVAEAFIPNTQNKPNVNHKDCNVKNNSVENLEWCTQSENILHCSRLGRHKTPEHRINGKFAKKGGDVICHV